MAVFFNNNRHVIPNWRSFERTVRSGELNVNRVVKSAKVFTEEDLANYYSDWKLNRNIAHAGDYISAAISNGYINNEETLEVANYVLTKAEESTSILLDTANLIISSNEQIKDGIFKSDHLFEDTHELIKIYSELHRYKELLRKYPSNAIYYVEMSRLYISLSMYEKAMKQMEYALYLAPTNRYVIRSAVRLYIHQGKNEKAFSLLRKVSKMNDPWLLAPEISLTMILGKPQNSANKSLHIIESDNYSSFSITELSSSLATLEFEAGNYKKSRKLFGRSLLSPNDNSLAQVQWANNQKLNVLFDNQILLSNFSFYEANAWYEYQNKNYKSALKYADEWSTDLPYAKSPIYFAFHVSNTHLKDFELSERILKKGLSANRMDSGLLNNLAYVYALQNKTEDALQVLSKVNMNEEMERNTKICLEATRGLIYFRSGFADFGRQCYLKAIEDTMKIPNEPELNWLAILNYAREELLLKSDYSDKVMELVERIPETENDEIIELRKEVVNLNVKRKFNT